MAKNYDTMGGRALDDAQKSGKNTVFALAPAERGRWEAALRPIVEEWRAKHPNGSTLLSALDEEVKKMRPAP